MNSSFAVPASIRSTFKWREGSGRLQGPFLTGGAVGPSGRRRGRRGREGRRPSLRARPAPSGPSRGRPPTREGRSGSLRKAPVIHRLPPTVLSHGSPSPAVRGPVRPAASPHATPADRCGPFPAPVLSPGLTSPLGLTFAPPRLRPSARNTLRSSFPWSPRACLSGLMSCPGSVGSTLLVPLPPPGPPGPPRHRALLCAPEAGCVRPPPPSPHPRATASLLYSLVSVYP